MFVVQGVFARIDRCSSREGKILDLKRGQVLVTRARVKLLQELKVSTSPLLLPCLTAPSTPLATLPPPLPWPLEVRKVGHHGPGSTGERVKFVPGDVYII